MYQEVINMKFTWDGNKKDIRVWLSTFTEYAAHDGHKHYFVFSDQKRGGLWTIMMYESETFTIHGRGNGYCDEEEEELTIEDLTTLILGNRKQIHEVLRATK